MRFKVIMPCIIMFSLLSSSAIGNVNFDNFHTPTINPGESGELCFTVENNYNKTMENVYLTVEIYKYSIEEESKNVNEISNPPAFEMGTGQKILRGPDSIPVNTNLQVSLKISASKQTPQGTYLVKMKINFKLDTTQYMMESIGYFSDEEWMEYQLNTTYLPSGCSGIIPEPSFTVREPIPMWPLYILIGAAVFFGFLAAVFYMQDKGTLPKLKR